MLVRSSMSLASAWVLLSPLAQAQSATTESFENNTSDKLSVIEIYGDRSIEAPGAYVRVDQEQIEQIGADHPAEVLNATPGVNVQINSGQEHLIALRSPVFTGGAGQGSFLLLENGTPVRAPAFGNVNALFEIHHELADEIEIVRGPGSAKYGSNAVHGLFNFLHSTPSETEPGYIATFSASTLERYKADASVSGPSNRLDVSFHHDAGWREASGIDMQKLTFANETDIGRWNVVTTITGVNLNQETATFIQGEDAYENKDLSKTNSAPEAFRDASSIRAHSWIRTRFKTGELSFAPYLIHQEMEFLQHFLPYEGLEENGHDSAGLNTRYSDYSNPAFKWIIGADFNWADGYLKETQEREGFSFGPDGPTGPTFPQGVHYDYDVETISAAAFGEIIWMPIESFSVLAGLRVEEHEYDYQTNTQVGSFGRFLVVEDRTDEFELFTPKLGVDYALDDERTIFANVARGQRAPQASDLYRLQENQQAGEIKVETLDSFEVGVRRKSLSSGLSYEIAAFVMEKRNFFFRDANRLNMPFGRTDHWGVESSLSYDWNNGWNASGQVSYAEHTYDFTRVVDNVAERIVAGAEVDTAPKWLADMSLSYEGQKLAAYVDLEYIGEYYTNAANTASYDGHIVVDLGGRYALNERVEVFTRLSNLLDERYADRADFAFGQDRYFPGEPRNLRLGLRIKG